MLAIGQPALAGPHAMAHHNHADEAAAGHAHHAAPAGDHAQAPDCGGSGYHASCGACCAALTVSLFFNASVIPPARAEPVELALLEPASAPAIEPPRS